MGGIVTSGRNGSRPATMAEPVVWITAFSERAVEHELRYWISDPESGLGNIQGEVFLGIWERFKAAGIRISYPRQDVRLVEQDESPSS